MTSWPSRLALISAIALVATARAGATTGATAGVPARSAEEAVRAAVVERLGNAPDITITSTGVTGSARVFRDARPAPAAWLGKPMRFTLITESGSALPVSVVMTVTGDRVIALRAIDRGEKLTAGDVAVVRGEIVGMPIQRLPTSADLIGGKALRPIQQGATMLKSFVQVRRAIEPGDQVIATAAGGAVQVTAEFTAVDGGSIGDVIRVANPATKRYVRGRIVKEGFVEVFNGR